MFREFCMLLHGENQIAVRGKSGAMQRLLPTVPFTLDLTNGQDVFILKVTTWSLCFLWREV